MKRIKAMAAGLTVLLLLSLLAPLCLHAQTKTWSGIEASNMGLKQHIRPFYKNGEVDGYVCLLPMAERPKGKRAFQLQTLDKNLQPLAQADVEVPITLNLLSTVFNEDSYMFVFVDLTKKYAQYDIYSKECKLTGSIKHENLGNEAINLLTMMRQQGLWENYTFQYPASFGVGKNFLIFPFMWESKDIYTITCVDPQGKELWKYADPLKQGERAYGAQAYSSEQIILLRNFRPSRTSKEMSLDVVALDQKTGNRLYEIPLKDDEKLRMPYSMELDPKSSQLLVNGEFFSKSYLSPSLGAFQTVYDNNGKEIRKSYLRWDDPATDKVLKRDATGKNDDKEYSMLHRAMPVGETYFYIFENYKARATKAEGMSGKSLGFVNLTVRNLVIVEMDKNLKVVNSHEFQKTVRNARLYTGVAMSQDLVAMYLHHHGGFDYEFANQTKNGKGMYVVYTSNNGERGKKFRNTITAQVYEDGKFTKDEIVIERDVDYYSCLPAQPGYILMTDYNKKTKTLESRLEKLNY